MSKTDTEAKPQPEAVVVAYKGFDKNMQCRDFQFAVGQTYEHSGRVEACRSGFHACENPLDVWNYYGPCDTRFARVELSGSLSRHSDDSKIAAATLKVSAELSLPQFIADAVEYIKRLCSMPDAKPASGHYSQLAASGHYSQLAASGRSSKLAASGDYSQLAASGESSIAMAAATGCTASAGERGCIVLTRWVEAEKRYRVSVGYVGENIKAGVAYGLDDDGNFVEAA
jgi:hypothetical protein